MGTNSTTVTAAATKAVDGMRTETVKITPAMAKAWLEEKNKVNRRISESHVAQLAWDIREGAWKLTPQGIAFNRDGMLVDGQHRLTAIVDAGVPVQMRVTYNYAGDVGDPIDRGRQRRVEDALVIDNITDGRRIVSYANVILMLQNGPMPARNGGRTASVERIRRVYERFRDEIDWALTATRKGGHHTVVLGSLAYAYPIAPAAVDAFAKQYFGGVGLDVDAPALLLRRRQDRVKTLKASVRYDTALCTLRAVQLHIDKKRMARLCGAEDALRFFQETRAAAGLPT